MPCLLCALADTEAGAPRIEASSVFNASIFSFGQATCVCEKEIVEDDFVEVAGGVLHDLFELGPFVGSDIAERLEAIALAHHRGDAGRRFYAAIGEKLLGRRNRFFVWNDAVAVDFEIDLADLDLL